MVVNNFVVGAWLNDCSRIYLSCRAYKSAAAYIYEVLLALQFKLSSDISVPFRTVTSSYFPNLITEKQ
jgi:hypothetical protein